jgi:hypothetical protein
VGVTVAPPAVTTSRHSPNARSGTPEAVGPRSKSADLPNDTAVGGRIDGPLCRGSRVAPTAVGGRVIDLVDARARAVNADADPVRTICAADRQDGAPRAVDGVVRHGLTLAVGTRLAGRTGMTRRAGGAAATDTDRGWVTARTTGAAPAAALGRTLRPEGHARCPGAAARAQRAAVDHLTAECRVCRSCE